MIPRLLLLAALAAVGQPVFAYSVWFSVAPSPQPSGQSYYVEALGSTLSGDYGDLTLYKNNSWFASGSGYSMIYAGGYTTDYGAQTVQYFADGYDYYYNEYGYAYAWVTITQVNDPPTITWTAAPANAAVNEWFNVEARGNDADGNLSNVFVWREWVPHAFADGGNGYEKHSGNGSSSGTAGAVTFMAQAKDSGDAYSPVIYHTVNVYIPNVSPTIAWVNNPPSSVYVNQWFNMQARANDGNGNLIWTRVWKDDQPFAFNGGGNGWEAYSDNNGAVGPVPGTITFKAMSGDSSGADSGFITHTVSVINRAPTGSFTINGASGNSAIAFGQTVPVISSVSDPDGNMSVHSFWWDQGNGEAWTHPYLTWSYPPNSAGWLNLNLGANGYDASGAASTRGFDFRPVKAGTFAFHNVVADPYAWVGVGASVIYLTVNKVAPNQSGWTARTWTGTGTAPAGTFAVTFSNPHSGAVTAPTGTPTFGVVSTSGAGASPTGGAVNAGTVFLPGVYAVRCSYPGDANYHAQDWDVNFTVTNVAPTASMTIKGISSGTTTGVINETLTIGLSGADADANLRAVNLWVSGPGLSWRNIRADSSVATSSTEQIVTDTAIHSTTNVAALGTVNRTYTLPPAAGGSGGVGTYQIAVRSIDVVLTASATQMVDVNVGKANQPTLTLNATTPLPYRSQQTLSTSGGAGTGGVSYSVVDMSPAGAVTLSGAVLTANAGVGWVDLQATKADDLNYNPTTSAVVRVNLGKAPLTITADNMTRIYGDTNPTLTVSYNGLLNGDTPAVVSGLQVNTTADPNSSVGGYPITPSGGTATNYTITHQTGTLTITRKPVTFAFTTPNYYFYQTDQLRQPAVSITTPGVPANAWQYKNPAPPPPANTTYATSAYFKDNYYFQVEATGNYLGTGECFWSIICCEADVVLQNLTGHTYDGTPKPATAFSQNPTGLNVVITYNGVSAAPVNAGSYAVLAVVSEDTDIYGKDWGGETTGTLVIEQANQATLAVAANATQVYGTSQTLSVTGGSGNGAVTYEIVAQSAAGVATLSGDSLTATAGTGWVDVRATKATGADGNYHPTTSNNFRITMAKADQTALLFNPAASQTYGTTQTLSATGGAGTGGYSFAIIAESAPGVMTLSGNPLTQLAANTGTGSVDVEATRSGDDNYKSVTAVRSVTLAKATATVQLGNLTQTWDGNPRPVSVATTPTGLTVNVTYNGSPNPPVEPGTSMVDGTVVDVDYQGLSSVILDVQKATPVVTWTAPGAITFGTALGGTQLDASASVAGQFTYTPPAGTFLGAATHTLNVSFTATDTDHYTQETPGSVQLVVNKAAAVGAFASRGWQGAHTIVAADLDAAFAHATPGAFAGPTGTITYSVAGATGAGASPASGPVTAGTVLQPGTYTVRAHYDGDANYLAATADATFTVTLDPNGDQDGDGIPNGFEETHGLDPFSAADASADLDADGWSNVAEFNRGSSPSVYNPGHHTIGNDITGWPLADADGTLAVGTTAGQLSVDKSGALSYSIPLWTTPGTAGMQPQLSLNYSSQGGGGIAGFGWSLGGVSMITRGPQTKMIDGRNKGVTLTADDRFYLDGQRLIVINGYAYGADGAEYRTELDSITKVKSYGTAGGGPAWFKVWTKAGLIIEFGNTESSAFDGVGGVKISWGVNRISDTKGNYMDFVYTENTTLGSHLLHQINYTGNGTVVPYASVRFEYENRTDVSAGYVAGSPVSNSQRLKYIRSCYGEAVARTYTLNYVEAARTERSMLQSLTETGSDGKAYPPLTFDYEGNAEGWDESTAFLPPYYLADNSNSGRPAGSGFIDFDGDGRTDFVAHRAGAGVNMAYRNTGTGWVSTPNYQLPYQLAENQNADEQGARFADVNSDGLVDFIVHKDDYGTGSAHDVNEAWLNTGSGWTLATQWRTPTPIYRDGTINDYPLRGGKFLDINGDGRVDFVSHLSLSSGADTSINLQVYLNTGTGWSAVHSSYSTLPGFAPTNLPKYKPRFIDLNGDGLPDLVANYLYGGDSLNKAWLNTGSGWVESIDYRLPKTIANNTQPGPGAEFVDANGDGLPDLLWYRELEAGGHDQGVALNTGKGWIQNSDIFSRFAPPGPLGRDGIYVNGGGVFADVNVDGIPDFIYSRHFAVEGVRKSVHYGNLRNWPWAGVGAPHEPIHLFLQENLAQTGVNFVDFNSDGAIDVVWSRRHNSNPLTDFDIVGINRAKPINGRLKKVTNGLGVAADVTYASLMDPDVYTRATSNADLPLADQSKVVNVIGPMYVVRSVINDNGAGGTHSVVYTYANLRSHIDRGSLGFGWMKVHDVSRDIRTRTTFRQDYPFTGQASYVKVTRLNDAGPLLSESTTTWAEKLLNTGAPYPTRLLYASATQEKTYNVDTQANYLTTSTVTAEPDDYGNIDSMSVSASDGFGKTTVNDYFQADATNWILGRLETSSVLSTAPNGEPSITRTSSFTYNTAGLLETETVEPDDDILRLTTTYQYDQFGNKISVEVRGKSLTADNNGNYSVGADTWRATTTEYDDNGRFPDYMTNAAGHSEDYGYDQARGVVTSLVGANELPTSWAYDGFGRKIGETRSDGTHTATSYKWTPAGSLTDSKYFVDSGSTATPPSRVHYDKFGRARWSQGVNGTGEFILQETRYDHFGRVTQTSVPYVAGPNPAVYWSGTTEFDPLDRPLSTYTPDDENGTQTISYSYGNFTATATDPKGRVTETVKNSQGWTVGNVRNKNAGSGAADYSSVIYGYDAIGNLKITIAAGVGTTLDYNLRGRKTTMVDPDMGTWQYRYNIFGELIWQKDAKGQIVRLSYNNLGRLTQRIEPEGTTDWYYDTSPTKGIGKLHTVSSPGDYEETHLYDGFGRPVKVTRKIDNIPYVFETAYDRAGRPNRLKYPATGLNGSPFSTRNVYNEFGYLKEIRFWLDSDTDTSIAPENLDLTIASPTGKVYWMADSYHVSGRIDGESAGNGVGSTRFYSAATGRLRGASVDHASVIEPPYKIQQLTYEYDAVGNVKRRHDAAPGVNRDERFYDADPNDGYDGLDRLKVHRVVGGATVTVAYAQNGNITSKSDVGSYTYSGVNAGPHAVTTAGIKTYQYDANGNMYYGGGRTVEWTSFNQMRKATDDATGKNSEFFFGAAHERVKQLRKQGTTLVDTTIYVGSYEKVTTASGGLVEHKHYIMAPTGRIAVFTDRSDFTKDTRFFHTDGLGSITVVTDEKGTVLKRYTYDAWGKQGTLFTAGGGATNVAPTTRGFTDHEMLSDLGLVHMNGRVYDPVLGRFLSADPFIGDPSDSQEYNRYSYVGNNPLNATDPSGYLKLSFKTILKIVAVVVVAYFTAGAAISAWGTTMTGTLGGTMTVTAGSTFATMMPVAIGNGIIGGLAGGMASGFAGSLLNGGSIGDAFKAGVIGSVAGAIGGGVAGAFSDGGLLTRTLAASAVGGATSEAMGGSFRDGALIAGAVTLANYGFQRARDFTDDHAEKAARTAEAKGNQKLADQLRVTDPSGNLRTDGAIASEDGKIWGPKWLNKAFAPVNRFLNGRGMAGQGSDGHFYDHAKWTGGQDGWLSRHINQVSKLHDWFNGSWGYNHVSGNYVSHGAIYDSAFTMFSFSGMAPAGALTTIALTNPTVTIQAYNQDRRRP